MRRVRNCCSSSSSYVEPVSCLRLSWKGELASSHCTHCCSSRIQRSAGTLAKVAASGVGVGEPTAAVEGVCALVAGHRPSSTRRLHHAPALRTLVINENAPTLPLQELMTAAPLLRVHIRCAVEHREGILTERTVLASPEARADSQFRRIHALLDIPHVEFEPASDSYCSAVYCKRVRSSATFHFLPTQMSEVSTLSLHHRPPCLGVQARLPLSSLSAALSCRACLRTSASIQFACFASINLFLFCTHTTHGIFLTRVRVDAIASADTEAQSKAWKDRTEKMSSCVKSREEND
jgi:hypothetical protein